MSRLNDALGEIGLRARFDPEPLRKREPDSLIEKIKDAEAALGIVPEAVEPKIDEPIESEAANE
jgi:hypothetical protein